MSVESIISASGGIAIALLWVLPTSRLSFLIVGPLCIVAGTSMLFLRIGTWEGPLVLLFGLGGLIAYAYRQRKGGQRVTSNNSLEADRGT